MVVTASETHAGSPDYEGKRYRVVALIVLFSMLGMVISYASFESVHDRYKLRLETDFQRDTDRRLSDLEQRLAQTVERISSVSAFYRSSSDVTAQEFRDFTAGYLQQRDSLELIGWAPVIFSEEMLDEPFDSADPTRGAQLPLQLVEPRPLDTLTAGYDLGEDLLIRDAVAAAFTRGHVQYVLAHDGLIFVSPTLDHVEWSGVVIAVLPYEAIAHWLDFERGAVSLHVVEEKSGKTVLARNPGEGAGFEYAAGLQVAGEIWTVHASPLSRPAVPVAAWAALAAGLAITFLLAVLVMTLASSADRARELVRQRTRELAQAEHEARTQAMRLADRVSHTNQVISSIPSILIGVDSHGVIIEWNSAVSRLTGIAKADALGCRLAACDLGKGAAEIVGAYEQCVRESVTITRDEVIFARADGSDAKIKLTVTPFRDSGERFDGCLIVGTDVTEQNMMELQLREAQRLEAVGRLAAGIAHEVNTPAQYVSDNTNFLKEAFDDLLVLEESYTQLLETAAERLTDAEKEGLDQARKAADREYLLEEVPRALEQSMDGIQRIADIVRAMKEFSHPGGGGQKEQVDFNRLISNAITVSANEWKYHAMIETDLDQDLPWVPCYPRELNQVVLNLIINAAHAIADKVGDSGERGVIRIATTADSETVQLRISDSGTGVPEQVRDKIFEPFFTTKEVGRGSGQGLALAYSAVVEQHLGELRFETETGTGTTFIVNLPLQPQEAAA